MKNRIFSASLFLVLLLTMTAGVAAAGSDNFNMPKDMKALLPATADAILAVSSLDDLDDLWRDLFPENPDNSGDDDASLSQILKDFSPQFAEHVDTDKPLLVVMNLQAAMGNNPFFVTGLMALKDKNLDTASISGLDQYNIVKKGCYIALSTDPNWEPATDKPAWADGLSTGLVGLSLDLDRIIETYRFLIEMGMAGLETQMATQGDGSEGSESSAETAKATVKMVRALLNSAQGLDLILSRDGDTVAKDFVFRTKPGSELAPGPQPSFDTALKLTRFLPGGENLLAVSAIDQSYQMEFFMDYYLASMHSTMDLMEPDAAQKYAAWYTDYLDAMKVSFAPSAMTLRFEKNNSSFQNIIKSDNPQADWNRLIDLTNGMNGFGVGLELVPVESTPFKGHEITGWTLVRNDDELQQLLAGEEDLDLDVPLSGSNLITVLRFLPGNIYLCRVDDHLLICGGPSQGLMEELISRVDKGKGKVDPRLKSVNKDRGGHVQSATVGDLNTLVAVFMEMAEEMGEREDIPWLTDQPLPFLQTLEIDDDAYQIHLEMEKPAIRALLKAVMDMEQE